MQQNKINYLDLASAYKKDKKKYLKIFDEVMSSGQYMPQKNVETLENKMCKFLKVKYCATLNSGTDALLMCLYSLKLKKRDEIITTPNTWYATIASILHVGLVPKFVDIKFDQNFNEDLIEKNIKFLIFLKSNKILSISSKNETFLNNIQSVSNYV